MTYEIGQHVRVDCVGPNHVQATGLIYDIDPIRFADGQERQVYIIQLDDPEMGKWLTAGDGEIVEVLPETPE